MLIPTTDFHSEQEKRRGIFYALSAALLFGAAAPLAKLLLGNSSPQAMAGLLYLGSGTGLAIVRATRPNNGTNNLGRKDLPWLAGGILSGGVAASLLLMNGLQRTPASVASLLLNLEAVFTAAIAWLLFREKFSGRVALGLAAVVAGGILLALQGDTQWTGRLGPAFVAGACLAWGIDNNFTQRISHRDPIQITMIKGLVAGSVNTLLALTLGAVWPSVIRIGLVAVLGFFGYGISLVLFVMALRRIGTTRTIAAFSISPFVGTIIGLVLFREPATWLLIASGLLMAFGVWVTTTAPHAGTFVGETDAILRTAEGDDS